MKLYIAGQRVTRQKISARHIAARRSHKERPNEVWKAVNPADPMTHPRLAAVRAAFIETVSNLYGRGKTMEEINDAVAVRMTGMDTGAEDARKVSADVRHRKAVLRLRQLQDASRGYVRGEPGSATGLREQELLYA